MYEEIRKYAIKLNETSPAHQIRIVELLEKVGEKVYSTTRVREGKGGDSSGYFRYDGDDWSINSVLSSGPRITIIIDSIELIEKLENYLHNLSTSHPDIKIGTVYINSAGSECTIESIVGNVVNYIHEGGRQYTTSKSNIQTKWKLKSIKKDPNVFKYKPGDKVKIRTDLSPIKRYKMFNNAKNDIVTDSMLFYQGQVATIDCTSSGKYRLVNIANCWTDEMFEGLAEDELVQTDTVKVQKYLDRPIQIGDYVERVEKIEDFLKDFNSTIKKIVELSTEGSPAFEIKIGKTFYVKKYFKVINPLHPSHPDHPDHIAKDAVKVETVEAEQPLKEEIKINQKSEKTKMVAKKTLKESAAVTVGQNKEALIIASKMEAGRILTKQVLKQVKPHVPMLLRGYLDTPLAPVILANAVAMLGNHTENKRVQQVAELMLLSAASDTVGAFNLDKIIDDVLSGVKLPAGVLDGDDE